MDAGGSTKGLHIACVRIGVDAWVTIFIAGKVDHIILDVGKIDHVLTHGIIFALLPEHASWFPCPQHNHAPYFKITWEVTVGFSYSRVHVPQRHWWHSHRLDIKATILR